jgi:mono/diheme cytochrome c family protein
MLKISLIGAAVLLAATSMFAKTEKSGVDTYRTNCAMCHGETGNADTPAGKSFGAPAFDSPEIVKKSDADLLVFIKKGTNKMPSWDGVLTNDQIKHVIVYIRTLQEKH